MESVPSLMPQQRQTIATRDAEGWKRYGCCFVVSLMPVLIVLVLPAFVSLNRPLFPPDDEIVQQSTSPDGAYVAAVVLRHSGDSLGPEDAYEERVLVRRSTETFHTDDNGIIKVEPVSDQTNEYEIRVAWKGNRTLLVKQAWCGSGTLLIRDEVGTMHKGLLVNSDYCAASGTQP
jgi:hypothetical protein